MMGEHKENGADLKSLMLEKEPDGEPKNLVLDIYPMHDKAEIEYLEALWFSDNWFKVTTFVPEKEIRDYFGEQIALYVTFASFYTKWLMYLAIPGTITYIAQF